MAELVDALASGASSSCGSEGSSPFLGTRLCSIYDNGGDVACAFYSPGLKGF